MSADFVYFVFPGYFFPCTMTARLIQILTHNSGYMNYHISGLVSGLKPKTDRRKYRGAPYKHRLLMKSIGLRRSVDRKHEKILKFCLKRMF